MVLQRFARRFLVCKWTRFLAREPSRNAILQYSSDEWSVYKMAAIFPDIRPGLQVINKISFVPLLLAIEPAFHVTSTFISRCDCALYFRRCWLPRFKEFSRHNYSTKIPAGRPIMFRRFPKYHENETNSLTTLSKQLHRDNDQVRGVITVENMNRVR